MKMVSLVSKKLAKISYKNIKKFHYQNIKQLTPKEKKTTIITRKNPTRTFISWDW